MNLGWVLQQTSLFHCLFVNNLKSLVETVFTLLTSFQLNLFEFQNVNDKSPMGLIMQSTVFALLGAVQKYLTWICMCYIIHPMCFILSCLLNRWKKGIYFNLFFSVVGYFTSYPLGT